MANGPNDFRDPKVTSTDSGSSGGMGRWIAIALGALLLLLLLGWLFGLFGDDDIVRSTEPVDGDTGTVIVTD